MATDGCERVVSTSFRIGLLTKMSSLRGVFVLFLLLGLSPVSLVHADITDGNSEHLKREHSLIKPYQGKSSWRANFIRNKDCMRWLFMIKPQYVATLRSVLYHSFTRWLC